MMNLSKNIENIITSYIPNYKILELMEKKEKLEHVISTLKSQYRWMIDEHARVIKNIMKTCPHEQVIDEYYSSYDGTQHTYICMDCNLTGDYTWCSKPIKKRRKLL